MPFSCDSPEKIKAILPRLEQELKDGGKFKDFYQFTFGFAKNPGQKGLGKQIMLENIPKCHIICQKKLKSLRLYIIVLFRTRNGCGLLESSSHRSIQVLGSMDPLPDGEYRILAGGCKRV